MTGDLRALLGLHLPGYTVRSVTRVGGGLDNVVYDVNEELIVRVAREPDAAATHREITLLRTLRLVLPLPVPEILFADEAAGLIAYPRLAGEPLHGRQSHAPAFFAHGMGRMLSKLHELPTHELSRVVPTDYYPMESLLRDTAQDYAEVAVHLSAASSALVERFLGSTPPREPSSLCFCHNDLGAEHILSDSHRGEITGILDWTDAAITDPAHDFALIYRDFGPELYERTRAAYSSPIEDVAHERVEFYARCALVEDLAYGFGAGPRKYAEVALANLERTFR